MLAGMATTHSSDRPFSRSRLTMWAGSAAVMAIMMTTNTPNSRNGALRRWWARPGRCRAAAVRGGRQGPAGRVAQPARMHRHAHQQVNGRQRPQRMAPAQGVDQPGRQRDEHRAGQPAQEGQRDDRAAKVMRVAARDHREHRAVQRADQRRAQHQPHRIETGDAGDEAVRQQAQRHHQRAAGHHGAFMPPVNPAAHRVGQQPLRPAAPG
jgi:hypothetical protein